ncbi:MAG: bifunctional UDP-N-acetylglucosamine diphosphorylase/glucosamine-1-phosphate N-acetyltransferase GlmU [Firmicutes bacterium]|nr:bifunctional UDP-N-acetylglucosamine diphosphorylase/glucosamine-1-phosphate N-acetyltransferase GlmU [Bacillota bacterium]
MRLAAVILAAGKGTRMKSKLPKVLHQVGGKPMLGHVLGAASEAGAEKLVVVAGYGRDEVESFVDDVAEVVLQEQQLGTAHALMQSASALRSFPGHVLVLCGDTPLITPETLSKLVNYHEGNKASATVLTANMQDPTGYGRIIRDEQGRVKRIVEQKDGSAEELAVKEINTGLYCFSASGLFEAIEQISSENAQGEYYLPDIIEIYNRQGKIVTACACDDSAEIMGINNRKQLAVAEKELRGRVLDRLMFDGVTIVDPDSTYVDSTVSVETDTVLYPGTMLEGSTQITSGSQIGPNTRIVNSEVGANCKVQYSVVMDSVLGPECYVGPYAYIRPGCRLAAGVKIGDFVEVKKSQLGSGSKVPHLSYIGDAIIGNGVNVGAGTITCNYDGKEKHVTIINDGAFIGSNTNLVAPVKVGEGALIAAGSTITKDVPERALGVARARQSNKENWRKNTK